VKFDDSAPIILKDLKPCRAMLKKKLDGGYVEYVRFFDPYKRMSGTEVVGYERLLCKAKSGQVERRLTFTLDIVKSREVYRGLISEGYKTYKPRTVK
jgi:hypothetical protein